MAALPRVQQPTFTILIPSLKRGGRFRPFTVKEEKILLMAKESEEPAIDHLRAIHQVVTNCLVDDSVLADSLTTFDVEWLFLKLRSASVGSRVSQSFTDIEERNQGVTPLPVYDFDINLDEVRAPEMPEGFDGTFTITLDSGDGVTLRYPPAILYTDPEFVKNGGDAILYRSTVEIFTKAERFDAQKSTQAEVVEYYDGWGTKDIQKVKDFIDSTPSMLYTCDYKNSLGHDHKIKLTSLSDFFTF